MPSVSFLPGIGEDSDLDEDARQVINKIYLHEKKEMIAFHQDRYLKTKKENLEKTTRLKKRERNEIPQENEIDDIPDDKSTFADATWSSFECRKKLKAKEAELSLSSVERDFIQDCEEYQEYLSSISSSREETVKIASYK